MTTRNLHRFCGVGCKKILAIYVCFVLGRVSLCPAAAADPAADQSGAAIAAAQDPLYLPANFRRVAEGIFCGAEPTTGQIAALSTFGIRTVLSVDGLPPDVAAINAAGLQVVHLPLGYSGIGPADQAALREIGLQYPSPIYIHCQHGKHRGPSAAAILAMSRSQMTAETATEYLRMAGTNPQYRGLWRSVEDFSAEQIDDVTPTRLVAAAPVSPATWMASLDRQWQAAKSAKGKDSEEHLALALQSLKEYRRGHETDDPQHQQWLSASIEQIEAWLKDGSFDAQKDAPELDRRCNDCHTVYRN